MPDTGYMLTPMMGNRPDLTTMLWGADNGCFASPHLYSDRMYIDWLTRQLVYQETCLFATAPDVLGDAVLTLKRSVPLLVILREMGYPAALVAQDGLTSDMLDWQAFDVLFVGGSTDWKLSEAAYCLVREAKARGKRTHMGRVNSLRRLKAAQAGGYDSADGTFLAFGPDVNLPRVQRWMRALREQPALGIATEPDLSA